MKGTLVMVMAGGKGSRLAPLTSHRAKPSVPFGGRYRIIDFALSNFVNSGYRRIFVLTQYMAHSLIQHLSRNWHLSGMGEFVEVAPAQMRLGDHWYRGTADSVLQNLNLVRDLRPDHVAVFGGDHIYLFDVSQMDDHHRQTDADLTVAAVPVAIDEAQEFGILVVDDAGRITGFEEKPTSATAMPGRPDMALASMGNYIFKAKTLSEALLTETEVAGTSYDFGGDVIPRLIAEGAAVHAYDFASNVLPGAAPDSSPYWRDVGTIDSYVRANAEARARVPAFDLYNRAWRIRTAQRDYPPARFVLEGGDESTLMLDSLVCEGSIVANASLRESVIGYDCFVHHDAELDDVILLSGCTVGSQARLGRVLADKNCIIDGGAAIGLDPESDRRRFPFVSPAGVVVLPKGSRVPAEGPLELTPDMMFALRNDSATAAAMEEFADQTITDTSGRHSSDSAGPAQRQA